MHEKGVSEEVARDHIRGLITEAWKKLNKAHATPSLFTKTFADACFNILRMSQCVYQYGMAMAHQSVRQNTESCHP
ncbi:putative terpene synthase 9 [Acorus gramineus]|uniref:Terpene synthase 9 n=1 Tax=Acorus gramineus TaxID=55184 RepID=A0AAV9BNM4_ACOGR|nr:putative terpene synthase 9 [Acorus gramineus]